MAGGRHRQAQQDVWDQLFRVNASTVCKCDFQDNWCWNVLGTFWRPAVEHLTAGTQKKVATGWLGGRHRQAQ